MVTDVGLAYTKVRATAVKCLIKGVRRDTGYVFILLFQYGIRRSAKKLVLLRRRIL